MFEIMNHIQPESLAIDYRWADAVTVRYNAALPSQYSMYLIIYGCDLKIYDQAGVLRGTVLGNNRPEGVSTSVTIPAGTSSLRLETKLLDSLPLTYNLGIEVRCNGIPAGYWVSSVSDWDKAKVRRLFFSYADKLTSVPNALPVNVEHIRFIGSSSLNDPNISQWDTSGLKSMYMMFASCSLFNQPVDNWKTPNVTDMGYLFSSCTKFNRTIASWNVSKVTAVDSMFANATIYNQDLSSMIFKASASRTGFADNTPAWLTQYKPKFTGT